MKSKVLVFIFIQLSILCCANKQLKIACIGNSVTYGSGLENPKEESYPSQLSNLLGEGYLVRNFGKPGATLLENGHRAYIKQQEYVEALKFSPDYVIIHLGLNDTDPRDFPNYRMQFMTNYITLINSFRKKKPNCKIWICKMSPISSSHKRFKSGTQIWFEKLQQYIERIAETEKLPLIDLFTPLYSRPDAYTDVVHPNKEGTAIIAKTVYQAITGDYGGLQLPITFTDNMVVQRNKPFVIKGIANSKSCVVALLGKVRKSVIVGKDGTFEIQFPPLKLGKTYTLTVLTETERVLFHNIVAGDVWLCSGQSNMAFKLKSCSTFKKDQQNLKQTNIRLFNMRPIVHTNATAWSEELLSKVNSSDYLSPTQWTLCNEKNSSDFSAIAYYFGKRLADSLNIPIGLVLNAVGGATTQSYISRSVLEHNSTFVDLCSNWMSSDMTQEWARNRAKLNLKKATNEYQMHPYAPSFLYEAFMKPLETTSFAGMIWYQGESNAIRAELHASLFSTLVSSYRQVWGKQWPIYFVQLSSLNRPSWPYFRNSQRELMEEIPFCGMAVSSDVGNPQNVHPTNKKVVGERLAAWSLFCDYGFDQLLPSGPLFKSVIYEKSNCFISFRYGDGLKTSDGKAVRGFDIAGYNGIFFSANARIENEKVVVSSSKVKAPYYVRYGWKGYTDANLVNKDNLPASTFVDKWIGE